MCVCGGGGGGLKGGHTAMKKDHKHRETKPIRSRSLPVLLCIIVNYTSSQL